MKYVPDSAEFRQHTISDGPYQITKYVPGKEFQLDRNPAWDQKTDSLRHAYVDHMLSESLGFYQVAWWYVLFPAAALLITTLAFNLLGDSVRDALDPRGERLFRK